ncbi:MAG: helical backbone metal receptor [Rhodothermales bacterium]|nr:helical backbone metal receptor [Rhodothermales bacterium]
MLLKRSSRRFIHIARRRSGRWNTPCSALLLVLGLLSAACAAPEPMPPRTVTDALGRTVAVPDSLGRLVTLAPNLTELVFAAGAGDRLAGASTADDYPPAIDVLPRFSALPLDVEAVAALDPDLVLATDQVNNPGDAATFEALGLPVYFFSYRGLDGMLESLRMMGRLLGTEAHANRTADALAATLDSLRARSDTLAARPLTLLLIGDETLYAFGDESYAHEMVALAGGRSATEDLGAEAPILSDEFVLTAQPEVIVVAVGPDYDAARLLRLHPTWDVVPAVRAGRVHGIDPDLVLRPGPRLVDGVKALARLLEPGANS